MPFKRQIAVIMLMRMLLCCLAEMQIPEGKERDIIIFDPMFLIMFDEERDTDEHSTQVCRQHCRQQKNDQQKLCTSCVHGTKVSEKQERVK